MAKGSITHEWKCKCGTKLKAVEKLPIAIVGSAYGSVSCPECGDAKTFDGKVISFAYETENAWKDLPI